VPLRSGDNDSQTSPLIAGDLVFTNQGGEARALDLADGHDHWRHELHGTVYGAWLANGVLVVNVDQTGPHAAIVGLDAADGHTAWTYRPPSTLLGDPVKTVDGGLAMVDVVGRLTTLDTANGQALWTAPGGDHPPVAAAGMVVSSTNDAVVAYDDRTGYTRWRAPGTGVLGIIGDVVVAMPTSIPDSTGLAGYDLASGRVRWRGTPLGDAETAATSAGVIVRTITDGAVRFFDTASGKDRWRSARVPASQVQPVTSENLLLTAETDGRAGQIVARSLSDGHTEGTVAISGGVTTMAAAPDGTVYAGLSNGRDNEIVAIRHGALAWRTHLIAAPIRPVAVAADGIAVAQVFDPPCAAASGG
jgi:outer membrane protein assembly factor BamB